MKHEKIFEAIAKRKDIMTRGEAITQIYALFNAPHNADINIVGLNKVLDDLCNSHPEQEEWPEEPNGHIAGGVYPSQRTLKQRGL
jgi:hypothetical protein